MKDGVLTVSVVEDSQEDQKLFMGMVQRWAERRKTAVRVSGFPSSESFLFEYDQNKDFDILLLDVELGQGKLSGIDLAKQIRAQKERAEIVFLTSHFEFIGEGYEVDALHYLVKPVDQKKLFEVLDKAAARLANEPPSLIVTCDGETIKILESEIRYVESNGHYIDIYTRSFDRSVSRRYRVKESISAFEKRLGPDFFRTHRCCLVNLKEIKRITQSNVVLIGGTKLPLARNKYDLANQAFIWRN